MSFNQLHVRFTFILMTCSSFGLAQRSELALAFAVGGQTVHSVNERRYEGTGARPAGRSARGVARSECSPSGGVITNTGTTSRQIQFAQKLQF